MKEKIAKKSKKLSQEIYYKTIVDQTIHMKDLYATTNNALDMKYRKDIA